MSFVPDWEVGQQVYFVRTGRWSKSEHHRVKKIGRKYVYTCPEDRPNENDAYWLKICKETGREVSDYGVSGRVVKDREAWEAHMRRERGWIVFQRAVHRSYQRPPHVTMEEIADSWRALFPDDDLDEAINAQRENEKKRS